MKHFLPDGAAIHYELHGNPKADQAFVFLNGFSQTTAAWAGVVFALSKSYRLLLVDLLNQGKSDIKPGVSTLEAHAAAMADLLRALELQKPIVVGISMGGAVAQRLLVNFPEVVAGGVLISTFAQVDAFFEAVLNSWEKAVLAGGPPLLLDVMLPLVLGRSYFEKPYVVSLDHLKQNKVSQSLTSESLLQQIRTIKGSKDYREELSQVQVPVLLVHGDEDPLCPVRAGEVMAEVIPGATIVVLPKAGHTLNLEYIPDLTKLLDTFAKQQRAPSKVLSGA